MPFKSDKALFLNADRTEVVEEGSPDAAFLLVGAGSSLDDNEAAKYGLKSVDAPEDKSAAPDEDKADNTLAKATKATKATKK